MGRSVIDPLRTYINTLRYMRLGQVYWLLRFRLFPRPRGLSVAEVKPSGCCCHTTFVAPATRQDMEAGVSFFGTEQGFEKGLLDWRALDKPKLWRYNLHYFDYLLWPCVSESRKATLIDSWIAQNPSGSPDAWEPYPVSLRIVNWIKFLVPWGPPRAVPVGWLQSLAMQAAWLERNLEREILANHYIKNAKALVFAGGFFSGSDANRWLKLGTTILREQIAEQFLPDGGHYELSPMYHCLCLEDLLDTWNLAWSCDGRVPNDALVEIQGAARRALDFLAAIVMPNDEIPLFNDSAFGIAPAPNVLFHYAKALFGYERPAEPPRALPDSGYFRLGEGGDRMIIDCGPVSPSYQPGHTHCDMLSYELALDDRPIVVDTGVHDYENSPERALSRSTRAHNTVSVDGQDQSEVWGVFRVARRARPLVTELSSRDPAAHFVGELHGFPRIAGGIRHRREVIYDEAGSWTIRDEVYGSGNHVVDSWIHLNPDLSARGAKDSLAIVDRTGAVVACIEPQHGVSLRLEDGQYFPRFGSRQATQVVRLTATGLLPITVGYRIRKAKPVSFH